MFLALKRWCNKVFIYGVKASRVRTRHAGVYVGVMHANESKKGVEQDSFTCLHLCSDRSTITPMRYSLPLQSQSVLPYDSLSR